MSDLNLIDFDCNLSFSKSSLASPLIPSPCRRDDQNEAIVSNNNDSTSPLQNNEKSSFLRDEDEGNADNNPFDLVMKQVVDYEQSRDDPYERVILETSECFDGSKLLTGSTNGEKSDRLVPGSSLSGETKDELISSIEMTFDHLPPDEDDELEGTIDDNLIQLTDSPPKETKIETQNSKEPENAMKDQMLQDQQDQEKKSTATTLLLSLKELIKDEHDEKAHKALDDLQKIFGINLDKNNDLLKVCLEGDTEVAEDKENRRKRSDSGLNVTYNDEAKKIKVDVNETVTISTLMNDSGQEKENRKPVNALKKSPSLRLTSNKSSPVQTVRSLSVKVTGGQTGAKKSVPSNAGDTKISMNETQTLSDRKAATTKNRPRLGTYTKQPASSPRDPLKPTAKVTRTNSFKSPTAPKPTAKVTKSNSFKSPIAPKEPIAKVTKSNSFKSPSASKEPTKFLLRRTSTTLAEQKRQVNTRTRNQSAMNETRTLTVRPDRTSTLSTVREDGRSPGISKNTGTKSFLEKKPERRTVLGTLDNQNRLANRTKTMISGPVKKIIGVATRNAGKENCVSNK